MSTVNEFPGDQWDRLREEMERGGAPAVIAFIESFPESERLKLYNFAQGAFGRREWKGKNFDDCIAVAGSGIAEALRRSDAATTPEERTRLKDAANILSYNLSADLAECWPGDVEPRDRRHFEAGLRAAGNCVAWREEFGKPADNRAMALWAKGMHEMSLGDPAGAERDFRDAVELAARHAGESGGGSSVGPDAPFDLNLYAGYLGLAGIARGDEAGHTRYAAACEAFGAQIGEEKTREDATFGLAQLGVVERKFVGTDRAAETAARAASAPAANAME